MTVFPQAKHDVLGLDGLLTAEEREVRDRVRAFAVSRGACCTVRAWGSQAGVRWLQRVAGSSMQRVRAWWACWLAGGRAGRRAAVCALPGCTPSVRNGHSPPTHYCCAPLKHSVSDISLPCPLQEKEIAPVIYPFWERAEFPFELVPGFQAREGLQGGTRQGRTRFA